MKTALRIGFFGRLGAGNLGNDASLEAVLAYVRAEHAGATLDAMCSGPEQVTARYDLPATELHWLHAPQRPRWRPVAVALSAVRIAAGLLIDAWRTASWVRRHHVVIVPGMGLLEATDDHPTVAGAILDLSPGRVWPIIRDKGCVGQRGREPDSPQVVQVVAHGGSPSCPLCVLSG